MNEITIEMGMLTIMTALFTRPRIKPSTKSNTKPNTTTISIIMVQVYSAATNLSTENRHKKCDTCHILANHGGGRASVTRVTFYFAASFFLSMSSTDTRSFTSTMCFLMRTRS